MQNLNEKGQTYVNRLNSAYQRFLYIRLEAVEWVEDFFEQQLGDRRRGNFYHVSTE